MSVVDSLIAGLDDGSFETKFEAAIDGKDKAALAALKTEMEAKAESIPDQPKRHLFKNGISSLQMLMDGM